MIETPLDDEQTAGLFAVADTLYPGADVRVGISAARSITQFGGAAAFDGTGLPLYGSPVHRRLMERIAPDTEYREVTEPVNFGSGPNRFTVYPVQGDAGRGTLVAWFPEHHLLYGSSLLIPEQFSPLMHDQRMFELGRLIVRYDLDVKRAFSMYMPVTEWTGR
jgi:hypothetical protein